MDKFVRISFSDGTQWDIPIAPIANNRAFAYKDEFGDRSDVKNYAELVKEPKEADYDAEFTNAKTRVITK